MYIGLCLSKLNDFKNAYLSFEKAIEKDIGEDYLIPLNYAILLSKNV